MSGLAFNLLQISNKFQSKKKCPTKWKLSISVMGRIVTRMVLHLQKKLVSALLYKLQKLKLRNMTETVLQLKVQSLKTDSIIRKEMEFHHFQLKRKLPGNGCHLLPLN